MSIRIVVTGGRDYANGAQLFGVLDQLHASVTIAELAHGACPYGGADILAEDWAKSREIAYRGYPAPFKTIGKAAGPSRNRLMLMQFKPDRVVAFPGGRGTANCISWAHIADIFVMQIEKDFALNWPVSEDS